MRQTRVPVLALFAENDLQVAPELNAPVAREALAANHQPETEILVLPGLNHLFQPSETGLPQEYPQIEQTIDPAVLEKITKWIRQVVAKGDRSGN